MRRLLGIAAGLLVGGALIWSQREHLNLRPDAKVGPIEEGFMLPTGWMVRPAGRQVPLETLPLASRPTADGESLVIVQSGYNTPRLSLHSARDGSEISRLELKDSFHGLALDGDTVYVAGGTTRGVYEIAIERKRLVERRLLPASSERDSFIGDVVLSPDRRLLYASDITGNAILVLDRSGKDPVWRIPTVRMPYRILFHPSGRQFLVTSWSDAAVARHDNASGKILQRVPLGSHTTDMIWQHPPPDASPRRAEQGLRLFVAAAHTNDVYLLSSRSDGELTAIERVSVALSPRQPAGMTPSALSLSADGKFLYVACSDANAVAVADVSGAMSRVVGFVPTGWYPTEAKPLPDGRLLVLNGKGLRSFPNPKGPYDTLDRSKLTQEERAAIQHVGRIQVGGMSLIAPFGRR